MKFSIIVPVYNAAKYLDEQMASLLNQTDLKGKSDFCTEDFYEIILIENKSSDDSGEKCDEYARKYPRVKAFHQENIGAFRARRKGISKAQGEYLIFADADDAVDTNMLYLLSTCIDNWEKTNISPDIVLYNAGNYDNRKNKLFKYPFKEAVAYSGSDKAPFYEIMCSSDALNAMWNKCVKRSLASRADGMEDFHLNHGEDLLQTAEYIDKAETIVYLKEILYYYRENRQGLTGSYHEEFMNHQIKAWSAFDEYANKWIDESETLDREKLISLIESRKSLTCTIGVKRMMFSDMSWKQKEKELTKALNMEFYRTYHAHELPEWAPEEDIYVHELQMSSDAARKLMKTARKHDIKGVIKKLIGR